MTKLRIWLGLFLVWLLLFFNIERFHEPLNIASFVYVLAALSAILVVVSRRLEGLSFAGLLVATLAALLVLKVVLNYEILGPALPISVTEACSLVVTLALSRQIAGGISEFETTAHDVLEMQFDTAGESHDSQAALEQEVRRARAYGRPLTLLALRASNASHPAVVARCLEEMQSRGVRKYINARLAECLKRNTSDSDVVAFGKGRFFVLCPEIEPEQADEVAGRLTEAAREQLGIQLSVGRASFPDEEVTLGGLFDKAESELQRDQEDETPETAPASIIHHERLNSDHDELAGESNSDLVSDLISDVDGELDSDLDGEQSGVLPARWQA